MNRLINVFPRAWRERYGEEFEALLEATPMSPLTVMDVLAYAARTHHSSFRERLRGDGVGAGTTGRARITRAHVVGDAEEGSHVDVAIEFGA